MRVFFLSEKSGALFVNGVYFGAVDGFERSAEIDPADGVFCECACEGYLSVRFRFDEEFLFSPPPQVKLYFSGDAVAVYCCDFLRADPSLSVLWQERVNDSLLTLCMQGRLQLNLENETGFHLIPLPERLKDCKPYACGKGILLEAENCFCLLARDGEIVTLADGAVRERDPLAAELSFHDSVGHTALCKWEDGALVSCSIRTSRPPTEATFALALFESALIGADCTPYLTEALRAKAGALKSFLGDFVQVVLRDDPSLVGLVYARRERVFEVRLFRVETEDGKISNLTEL